MRSLSAGNGGSGPLRCARRLIRARAAFTIIEVVVVMLILAVATALTVPALLPPPADDDLTAATRRLDALFGTARDSAARSGADVTVMMDSATGGVWLISAAEPDSAFGPAAGGIAAARARREDTGTPLDLPRSVRLELSKARAQFRFTATGLAFADSLTLRSPLGTHLITIDPWSGSARLQ